MKELYDDEYIQVWLNQDHSWIEFHFKKFTPTGPYKDSLERVYNYCRELSCNSILSDLREMKAIPREVQQWMESDWMPRMLQQGLRTTALVLPISTLAARSVKKVSTDDKVEKAIKKSGVVSGHFASIEEARAWLASVSTESDRWLDA